MKAPQKHVGDPLNLPCSRHSSIPPRLMFLSSRRLPIPRVDWIRVKACQSCFMETLIWRCRNDPICSTTTAEGGNTSIAGSQRAATCPREVRSLPMVGEAYRISGNREDDFSRLCGAFKLSDCLLSATEAMAGMTLRNVGR